MIFIPDLSELIAIRPVTMNMDVWSFGLNFAAHLVIETTDLPSLMEHGFFINEEHMQKRFSYYIRGTHPQTGIKCHCRSFTITDRLWTGELRINSTSKTPIADFCVSSLSAEIVTSAVAVKGNGDIVYHYGRDRPMDTVNCIDESRPLTGLWPWPRRAAE